MSTAQSAGHKHERDHPLHLFQGIDHGAQCRTISADLYVLLIYITCTQLLRYCVDPSTLYKGPFGHQYTNSFHPLRTAYVLSRLLGHAIHIEAPYYLLYIWQ
uniref:Uncharacterized protein n=1 Tax=Opuntia streptacantha TaxID=393608 RepID=A0A7C9AMS3_OPUST